MSFEGEPATVCLAHHSFLVGPWRDAGDGAVLVTQVDDEEAVVLILKPDDVGQFIRALQHAATPIAWCDECQEWHRPRAAREQVTR